MFCLATIDTTTGPLAVVVSGDQHWPIADIAPSLLADGPRRGVLATFRDWDATLGLLRAFLDDGPADSGRSNDGVTWLAPLLYPRKVICAGGTYADTAADLGMASRAKAELRPAFFMKPPSITVVGSGRSVPYPQGVEQLDWEVELAVVIGRTARNLSIEAAQAVVGGFTVGVDLSARDWQFHPHSRLQMDTFAGKAFDASCPLGPWIVPARFVPDPQALDIALSVNGVSKQSGHTGQMIWSVYEQIAYLSQIMTLEPGDVILTGTPSGAGHKRGERLGPGDQVEATIGGIGTLRFEIGDPPS